MRRPEDFVVGDQLTPVVKDVGADAMADFESAVWVRGKTTHNDPERAQREQLSEPIASGMMQLAYLHELMQQAFGDGWRRHGAIHARWLKHVHANDRVTVTGTVTAIDDDGPEQHRITVSVECVKEDGTKTAAGTASAVLPMKYTTEIEKG